MDLQKEIMKSIRQGYSVRFEECYPNYCRLVVYKDGYQESRGYMTDICFVEEMSIMVRELTNNVLKKISEVELEKDSEE